MEHLIWFFALIAIGLFSMAGVIVATFTYVKLAISKRSVAGFLTALVYGASRFPEEEKSWVGIRNRAYLTLILCAVLFVVLVIVGSSRGFEIGAP